VQVDGHNSMAPAGEELWRELGDDGELKAAYRGGCRACQNLQKERYAYEHVYQRCPPSSA
jgi:hypothetical protein